MRLSRVFNSVILISIMVGAAGCAKTETPAAAGELTDAELDNIVRRSYQYVAMYNVINKNAMSYGSQTDSDGWNQCFADMEAFIAETSKDPLSSGKVFGTRAFLNESATANFKIDSIDILRATAAHMGLYGNSAAEAIYPTFLTDADGHPLDASANRYTVTFADGQFPPVEAFWSLTMYDGATQLFVDNPVDRYLVNSTMMDDFQFNDDGSLTLFVQKDSPGGEMESNWLPAPDGPFYMVMRLYGPEAEALDGAWTPPPVIPAP